MAYSNEKVSKEVYLIYDGLIIAKATDFSYEVNKEAIDVSTLDSGDDKRILGGDNSWSVSSSGLVTRGTVEGKTDYNGLLQQICDDKEPLDVAVRTSNDADVYYTGQAIITSLSQSGSVGAIITYAISFGGDGILIPVSGENNSFPYTFPYNLV